VLRRLSPNNLSMGVLRDAGFKVKAACAVHRIGATDAGAPRGLKGSERASPLGRAFSRRTDGTASARTPDGPAASRRVFAGVREDRFFGAGGASVSIGAWGTLAPSTLSPGSAVASGCERVAVSIEVG